MKIVSNLQAQGHRPAVYFDKFKQGVTMTVRHNGKDISNRVISLEKANAIVFKMLRDPQYSIKEF